MRGHQGIHAGDLRITFLRVIPEESHGKGSDTALFFILIIMIISQKECLEKTDSYCQRKVPRKRRETGVIEHPGIFCCFSVIIRFIIKILSSLSFHCRVPGVVSSASFLYTLCGYFYSLRSSFPLSSPGSCSSSCLFSIQIILRSLSPEGLLHFHSIQRDSSGEESPAGSFLLQFLSHSLTIITSFICPPGHHHRFLTVFM